MTISCCCFFYINGGVRGDGRLVEEIVFDQRIGHVRGEIEYPSEEEAVADVRRIAVGGGQVGIDPLEETVGQVNRRAETEQLAAVEFAVLEGERPGIGQGVEAGFVE